MTHLSYMLLLLDFSAPDMLQISVGFVVFLINLFFPLELYELGQ